MKHTIERDNFEKNVERKYFEREDLERERGP